MQVLSCAGSVFLRFVLLNGSIAHSAERDDLDQAEDQTSLITAVTFRGHGDKEESKAKCKFFDDTSKWIQNQSVYYEHSPSS